MKKNKIGVLSYLSMFIVQCCPSIFVSTSPSLDETTLSSLSLFLYNNTISLLNQLVTTEPPNHLVRACLVITYHMWLEWVSEWERGRCDFRWQFQRDQKPLLKTHNYALWLSVQQKLYICAQFGLGKVENAKSILEVIMIVYHENPPNGPHQFSSIHKVLVVCN